MSGVGEERFAYVSRLILYGLEAAMSPWLDSKFQTMIENLELVKLQWEIIQATIMDLEEIVIRNPSIKPLLDDLKQLSFVVEDTLDECDFDLLRDEIEGNEGQNAHDMLMSPSFETGIPKMVELFEKAVSMILEKKNEMRNRYEEKPYDENFDLLNNSSLPIENHLVVESLDMKKLIPLLLPKDDDDEHMAAVHGSSVILLLGTHGARMPNLFDDTRIGKNFDLKGQACASNCNNVVNLTKNILDSFNITAPSSTQLDPLQTTVKNAVQWKKFLLIINDISYDSWSLWETVLAPLRYGMEGSKILITTGKESVARTIHAINGHSVVTVRAGKEQDMELMVIEKWNSDEDEAMSHMYEKKPDDDNLDPVPTSSLLVDSLFIGREHDMDKLIPWLVTEDDDREHVATLNCFSYITLVGMGGLGKTTLAQKLFNNSKVKNTFDINGWISASKSYDVVNLTKNVLESFHMKSPEFTQLDPLQGILKRSVMGKKFLLVLDDVSCDSCKLWKEVILPLTNGVEGSKILITTRDELVPSALGATRIHKLQPLSDESSRLLFRNHAFGSERPREQIRLMEIGNEIVEKCKGLPLSLKVIGRLLSRKKNMVEWKSVMYSGIWDVYNEDENILGSLVLSYDRLPSYLKPCFKFCGMLPKGYEYGYTTVQYWIANNFIQVKGDIEREIWEYLRELASRSLLEVVSESKYVMHDLIHDMAKYLAGKECESIKTDGRKEVEELSVEVRHLSMLGIEDSTSPTYFHVSEMLRTVFLLYPAHFSLDIEHGKNLRVLDLDSNMTQVKPSLDYISNLKHLRYLHLDGDIVDEDIESIFQLYKLEILNLSWTSIQNLSTSICNLKQLQYLCLCNTDLESLPGTICELRNLLSLDIAGTSIKKLPAGLGMLTNLQVILMDINYVCNSESNSQFDGRNTLIKSLLDFSGFENSNERDRLVLKFLDKICFKDLNLNWKEMESWLEVENGTLEKVLNDLTPKDKLSLVQISGFGGPYLPKQIDDSCFSSVIRILLDHCQSCITVAPLQRLFLESLSLSKMDSLTEIVDLQNENRNGDENVVVANQVPFGHLGRLYLRNCNSLQSLPILPSLQVLYAFYCKSLLTIPVYKPMEEVILIACPALVQLHNLSVLRELRIEHCEKLTCIKFEEQGRRSFFSFKSSMMEMCIRSCPITDFSQDIRYWSLLEPLSISRCPMLKTFLENNGIKYEDIEEKDGPS